MYTFNISPSSGSTFVDTFSASTNLSATDMLINWGEDDKFVDEWTHNYKSPGIYNVVLDSCLGKMYYSLTANKFPYPIIELSSNSSTISAGCDYCFTVNVTSDDIENSSKNLFFNSLSSSSFKNIDKSFYSHLIPQSYFADASGNVINSYVLEMTALSANNQIIGHHGSAMFCYHDDLPGQLSIDVAMEDINKCYSLNSVNQTNSGTVYQLTPLSSYCIGFISDSGATGNNQTSAFNIFRNNNVDHIIFGGDNSYSDARIDRLTANLATFNSYLSADDPEQYTMAIGNHDRDNGHLSAYNIIFPNFSAYESKTLGSGLLTLFKLDSGFNSNMINKQFDGITIGSKQYNWFVRTVSDTYSLHKVAVFHHPFLGSNDTNNERSRIIKEMNWNFEDFGVSLILNGHTHMTEVLEKDNVVIVNTSATTQTPISATYESPYSLYRSMTRAVALIYFYPNKFVVKIVDYAGNVLYTKEKVLNPSEQIYTFENLSGYSNVQLEEYNGNFSVSATNLSKENLLFENITIKSAS